jgi:hypothetical protein
MARASAAYGLLSLLVLVQKAIAQDPTPTQNTDTAAQTPNTGYNGGEDNPIDPSDAGAAGAQKGGFSLSKGGLVAIIVVISLVVILGGRISLLQSSRDASTHALHSLLRSPLLARKETPMGRPPVAASRISPSHRALDRRPACYETPESPHRCASRLASCRPAGQTWAGEGHREGPVGYAEAWDYNDQDLEHVRRGYAYAQGSRLERHDAAGEEVSEDRS